MTVRFYSSVAVETNLTNTISSGATSMQVDSAVGLPALTPFTMAVDYESPAEELVEVTNVAGSTLTIVRAIDGTSATSHNAGARVRHVTSARDFSDSRTHENSSTNVHGVAGEIVGTDEVQTLSNKTFIDATGTMLNMSGSLDNITINNSLGEPTRLNGVLADASDRLAIFDGPASPTPMASIAADGGYVVRNQSAADDTSGTQFKFRAIRSDGTTNLFSVLQNGRVTTRPLDGASGFRVIPGGETPANAIDVRNPADSANRFAVFSNGHTAITPNNTTSGTVLTVGGTNAGFVGNLQEWRNPANAVVGFIDQTGATNLSSSLTVGGAINANGLIVANSGIEVTSGPGQQLFAYKSTNTSRASTTTLTVDPDLSVTVEAGSFYVVECLLFYTAGGTGDINIQLNAPGGSLGSWTATGWGRGAGAPVGIDGYTVRQNAASFNSAISYGGGGVDASIMVRGLLECTAGTLSLSWAQAVSDPTATVLQDYSYLRAVKIF